MKQYKTVNNLVGWITFLIAATVYCMTIEPTASFWDCPEFITTGYKLEVGHPPGAPFFMLVANLFSQFASDASTVAKMVNYMSALMSGACILFLFWSITHLVRKLVVTDENNITRGQMVTIMGSGLVGALAYTFSDTFWFSAVEGEVYAFSSLFTAVVFWLILKWEDVANEPHSDRWLILIAYLTGLSKWAAGSNCSSSTRWACPSTRVSSYISSCWQPASSGVSTKAIPNATRHVWHSRSYSPSPCWVSRSTDTVPAR